ncbi:MAG: regulatory iron-sulfur-containing complex subunit RicT [candidate division WOR-3 bacterium]
MSELNNNHTELIYKIKINPFRIEHGIPKSDAKITQFSLNQYVVVQIQKEILLGKIISSSVQTLDECSVKCHILRPAKDEEVSRREFLTKRNAEIETFFSDLFKKFKLPAKVVYIDWDLNLQKVYCYLIADQKINYLLLYETAVDCLKLRVAIKQIGARDCARGFGGIGSCGRELCCCTFLKKLQSITIRMVQKQTSYIEPEKLSGICGKLKCCLAFETKS